MSERQTTRYLAGLLTLSLTMTLMDMTTMAPAQDTDAEGFASLFNGKDL